MIAEDVSIARAATQLTCTSDSLPEIRDEQLFRVGRGQALGSFTHWAMAAAVSWTFPVIAERSSGHAFAFYAVAMVLQLLWVLFLMPETKGVPL
jgi:hypothetical protein